MVTHIREMTDRDFEAVAAIRVGGRRLAYAGLMPQAHLDAMGLDEDAAPRRTRSDDGRAAVTDLVAEQDGEVVGWACFGPLRDVAAHPGACELYAIYVAPERISSGVGHALMAETMSRARAAGYERMLLWDLKDNGRARRFYERAGFLPDGAEKPFEVDGVPVPEVRYARRLVS